MAAPTFQAQSGVNAGTTGATSPSVIGISIADDIIICAVMIWAPNTAGTMADIPDPTNVAGWARIGSSISLGEDGKIAWFWKRNATETTNPQFARGAGWDTGTDTCYASVGFIIRGCDTTANPPWDEADATTAYTTANQAVDAVTVSDTERMVVQFLAASCDWATDPTLSGWTAGTVAESTTGTDAGFRAFRKDNVSASTGADALTIAAPDAGGVAGVGFYAVLGISFKPPGPVTWYGASSATVGFTGTTNGIVVSGATTYYGASSATISPTATTAAIRKALGASSGTLAFTATTNGIKVGGAVTYYGASSATVAFTGTTAAYKKTFGVSTGQLTFTATTAARKKTFGASSGTLIFTATTNGIKVGGATTYYGASIATLVFGATTAPRLKALGRSTGTIAFTGTTTARLKALAASVGRITFTATTSGTAGGPPPPVVAASLALADVAGASIGIASIPGASVSLGEALGAVAVTTDTPGVEATAEDETGASVSLVDLTA
jgi:hypothetical protein